MPHRWYHLCEETSESHRLHAQEQRPAERWMVCSDGAKQRRKNVIHLRRDTVVSGHVVSAESDVQGALLCGILILLQRQQEDHIYCVCLCECLYVCLCRYVCSCVHMCLCVCTYTQPRGPHVHPFSAVISIDQRFSTGVL